MSSSVRKTYVHNRKFYSLPDDYSLRVTKNKSPSATRKNEETSKLIKYIDDNIIGKNSTFQGPFGRRKVVYCDYIASGRSLQFIEDYILKEVLPSYGNTHSTTSITSLQSTAYRQEAREIIRSAVNASEDDIAIFAGHGCVSAIYKLIFALGFGRQDADTPIIFTGPCDQHTNLLPWREIGAQIVRINETREGNVNLVDLENQLQMHYHDGKTLIGCFTAISNITGVEIDTITTTLMLHQYGALAFWDYASAAPYVQIDMNPELTELNQKEGVFKDAVFFSGHKFLGGVQTPGILIAKKSLFKQNVPDCYIDLTYLPKNVEEYSQDTELREEGSMAAVVETVRAGLVMHLKETLGSQSIMSRAEKISKNILAHMRTIPEIILLGNGCHMQKRLPVFSFMVRHPRGTFLHHNFVCAVLNDVFGIQARSGCACAGPYAQDLLGISDELAAEYECVLIQDKCPERIHARHATKHSYLEILRPGFTRISLPFCMSEAEVTYVMEAIKMVATEAWKLLPQYIPNQETGEWRHHTNMMYKDRKWLGSIRYTDGKMVMNERRISGPGTFPQTYSDCLQTARNIFNRARKMAQKHPVSEQFLVLSSRTNKLRWFMLPSEAQDLLLGNSQNVKHDVPFQPLSSLSSRQSFLDSTNGSKRTHNATPFGSPRHFSLSSVDDRNPMLYPSSTMSNILSKTFDPHNEYCTTPSHSPHFALGEVVTPLVIQKLKRVPEGDSPLFSRNRCYSLGSEASPPMLSPDHIASSLDGRNPHCASHSDLIFYDSDINISPHHSITQTNSGSGSDCSIVGRASSPSIPLSRHNTDNLQAYLQEVTKELATEIKSEIREVISKVEDVLENTDAVDMSSLPFMTERHNSSSDESRGDSVSANDVAEYLVGVSKEMASEVKSEIREMVSAVDLQLDKPKRHNRNSPVNSKQSFFNSTILSESLEKNDDIEHLKTEAMMTALNKSHSSSKLSDEEHCSLDLDNKTHVHLWSTINSVSSQDSGINLSFHEHDTIISSTDSKPRSSSESSSCRRIRKNNCVSSPKQFYLQKPVDSDIMEVKNLSSENNTSTGEDRLHSDCSKNSYSIKWHTTPKCVWKPALEALEEHHMVSNGDKILVCLSGGSSSLGLLHSLLQYQYYAQNKGINFCIGAAMADPGCSLYETNHLVTYLKEMNVEYLLQNEEDRNQTVLDSVTEMMDKPSLCSFTNQKKRGHLYKLAKNSGYNVLAVGQHLDDVVENFLLTLFHNGKLQSMKAHYLIREQNLRIIRPLIYVREEAIKNFIADHNIPVILKNISASDLHTKEKTRTKHLLTQYEVNFPNLFSSLRKAIQPLMISTEFKNVNVTNTIKNDNKHVRDVIVEQQQA